MPRAGKMAGRTAAQTVDRKAMRLVDLKVVHSAGCLAAPTVAWMAVHSVVMRAALRADPTVVQTAESKAVRKAVL